MSHFNGSNTFKDTRVFIKETGLRFLCQINVFGKEYEIELHNSESILPGARVEYHKKDGIQTKLQSENTCFRLGRVTNVNTSSSAALSDCDGLVSVNIRLYTQFLIRKWFIRK